MSARFTNLLTRFAQHLNLPPESLLQTGEIVIDKTTVTLFYEGDEERGDIVFYSILGMPSSHAVPFIYRTLLEANMLWAGTGGGTLGLLPQTGAITLCGRINIEEITSDSLTVLLENFVDTAEFWSHYIENANPEVGALNVTTTAHQPLYV